MLNLDAKQLAAVTRAALTHAASDHRWVRAIERGAVELETNPWIEALDARTLLIGSASGNVYIATGGICSCQAFQYSNPCFHRAMARLYQRYNEARENANT